ncbi:hypothetical protein [Mesorhizobium sp. M7A.F.Ca.US.008.03.1.1]|nr:hypothetical protein [Mesorhizobium sp. M7A.F.Ca.US.008.03.1.1]
MIEHELLMAVAAPMLVASRPTAAMMWPCRYSCVRRSQRRDMQTCSG